MTEPARQTEEVTLDESGALLGDRYRLVRPLGEGAAGLVYVATDERLGAEVAVKVVRGSARRDEVTLARFHREAKAAGKLGHPNIVRVTDFGTSKSGSPFVVMERLEGETLEARIARDGPLDVPTALDVHVQLADALAAAHAAGVLHRDVKPANVFLMQLATGKVLVKLLDFGLAELYAEPGSPRLTERGLLVGSLAYLAPERIDGQPADERTDVYSVGASLFESLTGKLPFEAPNSMMLRARILGGEPAPMALLRPELDASVRDVVARCLARASERYATAADARRALLVALDEATRRARSAPPPPATPIAAPGRPRAARGPAALVAVVVIAALVVIAVFARATSGRAPAATMTPTPATGPTAATGAVAEPAVEPAPTVPAPVAVPEAAIAAEPPPTPTPVVTPTVEPTRRAEAGPPETSTPPARARRATAPPPTAEPPVASPPDEPVPEPEEVPTDRFDRVREPDWGAPLPSSPP